MYDTGQMESQLRVERDGYDTVQNENYDTEQMKSYDTIQEATPSMFQPTPKTHPLHHINVSTLTIAISTMNLKTHNTLHASTYTSEIHDA